MHDTLIYQVIYSLLDNEKQLVEDDDCGCHFLEVLTFLFVPPDRSLAILSACSLMSNDSMKLKYFDVFSIHNMRFCDKVKVRNQATYLKGIKYLNFNQDSIK